MKQAGSRQKNVIEDKDLRNLMLFHRRVGRETACGAVSEAVSYETAPETKSTPTLATAHSAFGERVGIREFDGGLSRDEAERLALADTLAMLGPQPEGVAR